MPPPALRHAVVIGGSLAGLCIARTLLDHVERVTVVERDRFPDGPQVRAGVPQAHHLHILVTSGQRALEHLFPGLMSELRGSGAVSVAVPTDVVYLSATGWRERFPATHELIGASRELIDWTIRRRLLADQRIRFLTAHEAVGLLPGTDGSSIAGVTLRPRGGPERGGPERGERGGPDGVERGERVGIERVERLEADLVVDASGRGSRTPDWLAALGYGRPEESRIDAGLGYASRRYILPAGVADGWRHILLMPNPPQTSRGGVLYPIEGDRCMVTLGGLGDEVPPTDEAGFLEFARELRSPVLYEAIRDAEPDSPIHGFRWTANSRRHYETMARWPDGFLVVGDAACAFNPVYGQGMSVAAQTAALLAEYLRTDPGRFGRAAQALVATAGAAAWTIATGADLRYPANGLRAPLRVRFSHWYLARTADVANRDPYVSRTLTDVLYLVQPPAALMSPRMALRVLRGPTRPVLTTPPVRVPGPAPGVTTRR